jgi:phage replication O-like protein O
VNHLDNGYLAEQNIFEGNRLNLFPEQTLEIYDRCINYLATCKLSSRCSRIFCVILKQTIGFKKLEDNVTSTRLEQLSKLRRDHASDAMRELARSNVIIHRRGGQYHNYVSINFNLESWGAGQSNTKIRSNDPRLLISDYYGDEAADQGIDLGAEISETGSDSHESDPIDQGKDLRLNHAETPTETPSPQAKSKAETSKKIDKPKANTPTKQTQTKTIKSADKPKTNIQTKTVNPADKVPAEINTAPQPPQLTEATLGALIKNMISSALNGIEEKLSDQIQSVKQEFQSTKLHQLPPIQASSTIIDNANNNTANSTQAQANHHSNNSSIELEFPVQLSEYQRQELEKSLLPQAGDDAQPLLKLLAKRLNNTADPVKNPMAYMAYLLKQLQAGTLDLSPFRSQEPAQPQPTPMTEQAPMNKEQRQRAYEEQILQAQIDAINDLYVIEYRKFDPILEKIEQEAKKMGLGFTQAAKEIQLFEQYSESFHKLADIEQEAAPLIERLKVLKASKQE